MCVLGEDLLENCEKLGVFRERVWCWRQFGCDPNRKVWIDWFGGQE